MPHFAKVSQMFAQIIGGTYETLSAKWNSLADQSQGHQGRGRELLIKESLTIDPIIEVR